MSAISIQKENEKSVIQYTPEMPTLHDIEEGVNIVIWEGLKAMKEILSNVNDPITNKPIDVRDRISAVNATVGIGRYIELRKTNEQKKEKVIEIDDADLVFGE